MIPNPIIVEAEVVVSDLSVNAEAESNDQTVTATAEGERCPMPNISIGDVQEGDEAAATMTGTYAFPVLNLVLPRGPQGEQGPQGEPGQRGETGATGQTGPQGPAGSDGDRGPAGQDGKDGKDGSDYVLTSGDKEEIAAIVLAELPFYDGGVSS